ncbi:hypothetical protein GCM10007242_45390 [Pigmentiphaga litoralis]|uniref:toll/interleukin-1 receptor domain-containing protein n=1 Tax=Pigmentiphaga litoralis TaxID=516702 RepID=UPI00167569F7|nr:toll/interleukin-1 receptor domain-containing protein [Pigmentiphaga litoralis]GGX33200.1 hypothetical protein GCM10007242_45390 [Pigmentiphaga litoralis]
MSDQPPRVFVSYSHDTDAHKHWVLTLASRLVANGVDVILDQWDLTLGSDLPRFMELGLTGADRVLAICTDPYVAKANGGRGGVAYEKMILSGQLMRDVSADRIIPVVINNTHPMPLPTFLSTRLYIDFSDETKYEARYAELIHELHGEKIKPRPPLGKNPFRVSPPPLSPVLSFGPERYVMPGIRGTVTFDFENNNGRFVVGAGDYAFPTRWSGMSQRSIYALMSTGLRCLARAVGMSEITDIGDAEAFDTSSNTRAIDLGEIVIWQNPKGYYLATKVEAIKLRSHGDPCSEVTFSYVIDQSKTGSFTT